MANLTLRLVKGVPLTNQEVDDNFSNLNTEILSNSGNVGVLANLNTNLKSNIVTAINEVQSNIGILSSLTTTTKSNIVVAVNEVKSSLSSLSTNVGTLSSLTTADKTSIVAAINETRTLATGYTDANARLAISVTGAGSYDNTTGVITITGGVTSVGGAVGAISNAQLLASIQEATGGGGGGGLDASTLDGFDSTYFINTSANTQTKSGSLILSGNIQSTGGFLDSAGNRLIIKDQNGSTVWG